MQIQQKFSNAPYSKTTLQSYTDCDIAYTDKVIQTVI